MARYSEEELIDMRADLIETFCYREICKDLIISFIDKYMNFCDSYFIKNTHFPQKRK
jgi:hypothetical protein